MKQRTKAKRKIAKTSFDVGLDDGSSGRCRRHSFDQWMHRGEYNRGYQIGMRRRSGSKWAKRKYNRISRWCCKPMFIRSIQDSFMAKLTTPSQFLQTCVVESRLLPLRYIEDV